MLIFSILCAMKREGKFEQALFSNFRFEVRIDFSTFFGAFAAKVQKIEILFKQVI